MLVSSTRRLCRLGLAVVLVTALCLLTLLDLPPQLPDLPADSPPTPGGEPPGTRSIVAYSWARRLALDYRPSKKCDGNGTSGKALNVPALSGSIKWLETIPGQLFLYSAHLDLRVRGYPSVRVIGVKRGPLPASTLFCTVWYEEHGLVQSFSMEALISSIWLDEWGGTTDSYTGILVTCQLPRAIRPSRIAVVPQNCYENPSHSIVVTNNGESREKSQFTLCIKGMDFDRDISSKLVSFIELNRILGAEYFYFYVFNLHENVLKVLKLYEKSNVVRWFNLTLPGDLPNENKARRQLLNDDVWIKRRMELIPYNHCFYDSLYRSEFVIPLDIDETIIPRKKNWSQLLLNEKKKLGRSFKDFASYSIRNAYFFPELQNKSYLDDDDKMLNYLDTIRTARISPEGDSVKSFISTRRALTVHNHYALTTLNPSTRRAYHLDPKDVLKHHHRICDDKHLDCDLLMEDAIVDKSVLKYSKELQERTKRVLENLNALID